MYVSHSCVWLFGTNVNLGHSCVWPIGNKAILVSGSLEPKWTLGHSCVWLFGTKMNLGHSCVWPIGNKAILVSGSLEPKWTLGHSCVWLFGTKNELCAIPASGPLETKNWAILVSGSLEVTIRFLYIFIYFSFSCQVKLCCLCTSDAFHINNSIRRFWASVCVCSVLLCCFVCCRMTIVL